MRLLPLASAVVLVLLASTAVFAQPSDADRATARSLGLEGQQALKRSEFQAALELFQRADALYHAPTLLLGIARAQVGLGKLVAARESYLRMLREGLPPSPSEAFRKALSDAEAELKQLEPRIPHLILTLDGPSGTRISLDAVDLLPAVLGVRRPAEPGLHRIQASAPGFQELRIEFSLQEGETRTLLLRLEPLPSSPVDPTPSASVPPVVLSSPPLAPGADPGAPSAVSGEGWYRTAGWVGLGLGGAGMLVGGIWGLLAIDRKANLDDACPTAPRCPSSAQPLQRSYERAGTLSTIGFGVGLLGIGAGASLLLLAPPRTTSAAAPCSFQGQFGVCGRL